MGEVNKHTGMMSWQAYRYHRFRQARMKLFGGNLLSSTFSGYPNSTTIIIDVDEEPHSVLPGLITELLDQLPQTVNIVLRVSEEPFSTLHPFYELARNDIRIKILPLGMKISHQASGVLIGEFCAFIVAGTEFSEQLFHRLLEELWRNQEIDILYVKGNDKTDIIGNYIVARSSLYWLLGEFPNHKDLSGWLTYWQQASLLLRVYSLDIPTGKLGGLLDLALALEGGSTVEQVVQFDFIRDFYLTPVVCLLLGDEVFLANHHMRRLITAIRSAGYIVVQPGHAHNETLHQSGIPGLLLSLQKTHDEPKDKEIKDHSQSISSGSDFSIHGSILGTGHDSEQKFQILCQADQKKPFTLSFNSQASIELEESSLLECLDIWVHSKNLEWYRKAFLSYRNYSLKISVVISTYCRPQALRRAVQSVIEQEFPSDDFEIIVVNNDIEDHSAGLLIDELRKGSSVTHAPLIRHVLCPLPGISYARNLGILESRGEVVCFLDDDAVAAKDWLKKIWTVFRENPQVGVIGGHILLTPPEPTPRVLRPGFERFWSQFITNYDGFKEVDEWMKFPWGANWSARRDVLLQIGGFRSQYGRAGKGFGGGEELIAAIMAHKLGYTIGIHPGAVVYHNPDPSRYTLHILCKTMISQIVLNYHMRRDGYLLNPISLSNDLQGIRRFLKRVAQLASFPKEQKFTLAIEYCCYLCAWNYLLLVKIRDIFARYWHRTQATNE